MQVSTRWKALGEIYKIYTFLHRSAFKNSARFRQTFWHFLNYLRPCTRRAPQFLLERQEIEREGRVGEGVIQTGQSTVSRCRLRFFFLLRFEGAASMMSGDKTALVMTSWTTKVLNSRRRRRRFLEFRSFASAATAVVADDRPRSLAAYACGTAKGQGRIVMSQKLNAIL